MDIRADVATSACEMPAALRWDRSNAVKDGASPEAHSDFVWVLVDSAAVDFIVVERYWPANSAATQNLCGYPWRFFDPHLHEKKRPHRVQRA